MFTTDIVLCFFKCTQWYFGVGVWSTHIIVHKIQFYRDIFHVSYLKHFQPKILCMKNMNCIFFIADFCTEFYIYI